MPQYFNWRSGFNRNLILSRIDGVRKIDSQRCSFSPAQELHFWLPVLNSAILAHSNVGLLKASCVMQSLSDASLKLNDPDAFLVRYDQAFANLSKRPQSKFILYTTVTYKGPKVIDWISDGSFRIYWQPDDRGRFVRAGTLAGALSLYEFSNLLPLLSLDDGALPVVQFYFRCAGVIWPTPGRQNMRNTRSIKLRARELLQERKGRSGLERFRRGRDA